MMSKKSKMKKHVGDTVKIELKPRVLKALITALNDHVPKEELENDYVLKKGIIHLNRINESLGD